MSVLIIIPTYNEKENLEGIAARVLSQRSDINVLIIDDNSPDGTGAIADRLAGDEKRIHVIHRNIKNGLGAAYMEGFKYAVKNTDAEYIMEMDADFSHNPDAIPSFVEMMKSGDVVIGSRFYQGRISIVNWPLSRLILSYGASIYVRLFTRLSLSDPTSGFKCFKRRVIEAILEEGIISNGYAFQIEVNYLVRKMGFSIKEVPIVFYDRDKGQSKMKTLSTIFEAAAVVWRLKLKRLKNKYR